MSYKLWVMSDMIAMHAIKKDGVGACTEIIF